MAQPPTPAADTRFFGSQIGGRTVINYGYTDLPWTLMAWDIYYFFRYSWSIPFLLWPVSPADSGELSELSPTWGNLRSIVLHLVLGVLQLAGLAALPVLVVFPVWTAAGIVAVFLLVNQAVWMLLNTRAVEYHSDPEYAPALPEHAHEQWIFINGVAAGSHWMQSNLNRLAVTFKRPVLGIHNKTFGILFDVVESLIQRNWGYATTDVRVGYPIIKQKLYDPRYSKVILILHSQGGIVGSLVLDWLLQELPQDLLSKLEIYTFGNAANHFNNPHRYLRSQALAQRNPLAASTDSTELAGLNDTAPDADRADPGAPPPSAEPSRLSTAAALTSSTTAARPARLSGRVVGYIEHYAHTTDFVALWGVLHFATSARASPFVPRFIGRVFTRTSHRGGHQMVQHYLDGMFPLRRDPATGRVARRPDGIPCGAADGEGENPFVESEVLVGGGVDGTGRDDGLREEGGENGLREVKARDFGPVLRRGEKGKSHPLKGEPVRVKIKELSRLWQYRNGRSPEEAEP